MAHRWLEGDRSPRAALIRLFLLSEVVDAADAEAALGDGLEALAEAGLLREEPGGLTGTVEIVPHDELLIASDRRDAADESNVVPGLHRPSATLGTLTVRRPVRRALDVGTGNGIQAILVSPFSEQVIATDVNERALAFAALNATLNGVGNIELRLGSFLEPVAGERFGLVVANPPYVISPESRYLFRDGGLGGDRVSAELVHALPDHLEPGGFASVMVSWVQEGEDVGPRVREWVDGRGCDTVLLHSSVSPALTAAGAWNRDLAGDADRYAAAVDEWAAYFRAEGIAAIGYGTVVLRRRAAGEPWFRVIPLPETLAGQASEHLQRIFAGVDAASEPDETLAARVLAPAQDLRIRQTLAPGDGGWQAAGAELTLERGIGFRAGLDERTLRLVTAVDGTRTAGEVVGAVVGSPDETGIGLDVVRRLLELGVLRA